MAFLLISMAAMATQNGGGLLPPHLELSVDKAFIGSPLNRSIDYKIVETSCTVTTDRNIRFSFDDCEGNSINGIANGQGTCTAATCTEALNCASLAAYHQAWVLIGQLQFVCPPA